MNKEEIINKYPSLCYTCRNARKPASDENRNNGYVGCCAPLKRPLISDQAENDGISLFISEVLDYQLKEAAEGWVDLRSNVFNEGSGIITNYQLLTLEVRQCKEYE